jgi:hypothetical protein
MNHVTLWIYIIGKVITALKPTVVVCVEELQSVWKVKVKAAPLHPKQAQRGSRSIVVSVLDPGIRRG